jgi:hypothetical protein
MNTIDPEKVAKQRETLSENTQKLFDNVSDYMRSELEGFLRNLFQSNSNYLLVTSEDFKLLETMNQLTKEKYSEMTTTTRGLADFMEQLQKRCNFLMCNLTNWCFRCRVRPISEKN